jgi:hypothetical protein
VLRGPTRCALLVCLQSAVAPDLPDAVGEGAMLEPGGQEALAGLVTMAERDLAYNPRRWQSWKRLAGGGCELSQTSPNGEAAL